MRREPRIRRLRRRRAGAAMEAAVPADLSGALVPGSGRADPAARGAGVGRPRSAGGRPADRVALAIERFNLSPEARTVAGLVRSLGEPQVSVGAAAGAASEVRITVAWELCWYQWGVDLSEGSRPVRAIAKGGEVSELDSAARQWNASAERGGRLRPGQNPRSG